MQSMETASTAASISLSAWKIQTENLSCNLNISHHDHHWATSCDCGLSLLFFLSNMQVHVSSVCAVWIPTILVYVSQQCYWTPCKTTNPAWVCRDSIAKLNHVTAVSSISVHCWKHKGDSHTKSLELSCLPVHLKSSTLYMYSDALCLYSIPLILLTIQSADMKNWHACLWTVEEPRVLYPPTTAYLQGETAMFSLMYCIYS